MCFNRLPVFRLENYVWSSFEQLQIQVIALVRVGNFIFDAPAHAYQMLAVGIQENSAVGIGYETVQLTFRARYAFQTTEAFQMRFPNVGNNAVGWQRNFA